MYRVFSTESTRKKNSLRRLFPMPLKRVPILSHYSLSVDCIFHEKRLDVFLFFVQKQKKFVQKTTGS